MPLTDIHIHHSQPETGVVFIRNLFPDEPFPEGETERFFSVGLHPWFLKSAEENAGLMKLVAEKAVLPQVVAVGECGLDKLTKAAWEVQTDVFVQHVLLSERLQKPLIVHCVRAHNEIFHFRRQLKPTQPWVIHGYTGNENLTRQLLGAGFLFSFGYILLNEKARAAASLQLLPPGKFFLETDDFEVTIGEVFQKAAQLRQVAAAQLQEQLLQNFQKIFLKK